MMERHVNYATRYSDTIKYAIYILGPVLDNLGNAYAYGQQSGIMGDGESGGGQIRNTVSDDRKEYMRRYRKRKREAMELAKRTAPPSVGGVAPQRSGENRRNRPPSCFGIGVDSSSSYYSTPIVGNHQSNDDDG
jgi:hypothetical protein